MSLLNLVIAKTLGDQRDLPPDAVNRLMVTSYALGKVASPLAGALVTKQLVDSEPVKARQTELPSQTPVPALKAPEGLVAGDYVGKPFDEVAKPLIEAGVIVQRIDVKGTSLTKDVIAKAQVRWQADLAAGFQTLKPGDILQPNDTVKLAVSVGEALITVPDVTGLKFDDAASALTGFKVERREIFNEKWDRAFAEASANHVLGQAPDGGEKAAKGSIVVVTTGKPLTAADAVPGEDRSFTQARGGKTGAVLEGAKPG